MLSIIIPVYKVARTLSRCVESVLAQTGVQMEVILVDDGSPDDCPQLCNDWAARDSRVSVVHKANGGLSDARNTGLDKAKGEIITFVDSDDFLSRDTYHKVLAEMTDDVDIIEFPVYRFYGSERLSFLAFDNKVYTSKKDYWYQGKAYAHAYAWNKLYRRQLFDDVRFPKGVIFEDVHTLPLLLDRARAVKTIDQGLYYYCENKAGITATANGDDLESLLMAHLNHWDVTEDDEYYLHVLNIQIDVCRLTGMQPVMPEKKVADYKNFDKRLQRKGHLLNTFGLKKLCAIYRTWERAKRSR